MTKYIAELTKEEEDQIGETTRKYLYPKWTHQLMIF